MSETPDPAPSVKEIFFAVIELPAEKRSAYLDQACGRNAILRAQVEAMLRASEAAPDFLARPTDGGAAAGPFAPTRMPVGQAGQHIGRYKLLQLIGEGGFGEVWMGDQEQPIRRRVALKIIKLGMDTRQVIARFEAERQALAMMDHPNIARVLDGGATDSGRPFFVMELVKGEPIIAYCDRNNLDIRQRLELFTQVCNAVQHAHQKGIIHRDIKDTNILVSTQDGRPFAKVIDFGIAKATDHRLTEKTLFTEFHQLIGTPQYMSPEQAEGSLDIDTRTDVYSLGVLLYELLTGTTPFDAATLRSAAYGEMQRIIREVEPPKPSTRLSQSAGALSSIAAKRQLEPRKLGVLIRGDLDWIVMKALEKDRARRYETASGMAADIGRHVAGEAVIAAPPSTMYRIQKFTRKHKATVVTAFFIAAVLMVATSISVWFAFAEARQRTIANVATRDAERRADLERRARNQAEAESYVGNLLAAHASISAGEFATAQSRLSACPPQLRGWEWRYLSAELDHSILSLPHDDMVSSAELSRDGSRVLTGCRDGKVRIWDVATGSQLLAVTVDAGKWTTAKFSPDCQRFLATSEKKLAVFEAITGRQLLDLTGEDNSFLRMNPTFSPDGRLIALNRTNGTVILRDAFTGVELKSLRGHTDQITAAEFSSDGHRFLTLSQDKSARIWNVTTGEPILVVSSRKNFSEIAIFSPDGSKVFIAEDEGSKLFDAITGIELVSFDATIVHGSQARFSPDGTKIALIDGDRNPRILDAQTGKILHTLNGGGEWYSGVEFNREGSRIVTASDHYASVWDVTTGEWLWDLPGPEKRTDTALFTPDGTRILTASGNEVRFWDAATRLPSIKLGNTAFIRDLGTNRGTPTPKWGILTVIMHPPLTIDHRKFGNLEIWLPTGTTYFCRDGSRAVTHTWSQERPSKAGFSIWDVGELRLLANIPERDGYTRNVDIHPDGSRVLTSGTNGLVIWEAATGRELFTIPHPRSEVIGAEFTPDGSKIAITVADSVIEIIDATNGTPLKQFRGIVDSGSHFNGISCIAFNAAGDRMAAGQLNGVTCIWDLATQARLMELKGHGGEIKTVAFHPDGSRIATVAADGAIRIWDLGSGQELLALRTDSEEEFAVFSPDGTSLISSRIWDTVPYRQRYTQMMRSPASRPSTTAPTSN